MPVRLLPVLLVVLAVAPASAQASLRLLADVDADRLGAVRQSQDAVVQALRQDIGVPAEATDTFPPFLSLRADLSAPFSEGIAAGVEAGFSSTGGRVDYRDRSGSYQYDQAVRRAFVGVLFDVSAGAWRGVAVSGTARHRLSIGRIEVDETLALAGRSPASSRFTGRQLSSSLYGEGAAEVGLAGPLRLRVHAGWELTVGGGIEYEYEGGATPLTGVDLPDLIDWSGPRVGVGLVARLGGGSR